MGDGCTAIRTSLTPPNCMSRNGDSGRFDVVYILTQLFFTASCSFPAAAVAFTQDSPWTLCREHSPAPMCTGRGGGIHRTQVSTPGSLVESSLPRLSPSSLLHAFSLPLTLTRSLRLLSLAVPLPPGVSAPQRPETGACFVDRLSWPLEGYQAHQTCSRCSLNASCCDTRRTRWLWQNTDKGARPLGSGPPGSSRKPSHSGCPMRNCQLSEPESGSRARHPKSAALALPDPKCVAPPASPRHFYVSPWGTVPQVPAHRWPCAWRCLPCPGCGGSPPWGP